MRGVLAGAAAGAILAGCNPRVETSASPAPSPSPTSTGIALKITGHGTPTQPVRFVQSHGNWQEYDLLAQSFQSVGAQGSALVSFKDVHVTFHGRDGSTLKADAPAALLDQSKNTIQMTGGVRARSASGTTVTCDRMLYDHDTQMVYGSGHVVVVSKNGFRATGSKFKSNIALTSAQLQ